MNDADFEDDLRAVLGAMRAKLAGDGDQEAGRSWARANGLDWDKPIVQQLTEAVAADGERDRQESILFKLKMLKHSPLSAAAWEKQRSDLIAQLGKRQ